MGQGSTPSRTGSASDFRRTMVYYIRRTHANLTRKKLLNLSNNYDLNFERNMEAKEVDLWATIV